MEARERSPRAAAAEDTEVSRRELQIFQLAQCVPCSALAKAVIETPDGRLVVPAKRMERYMAAHLPVVREADKLGEHDALLAKARRDP